MRERAARLFALALKARERGYSHADELTKLAAESLAQAEEMESRERAATIPSQPQPADGKED
jgi:hypothetical protein